MRLQKMCITDGISQIRIGKASEFIGKPTFSRKIRLCGIRRNRKIYFRLKAAFRKYGISARNRSIPRLSAARHILFHQPPGQEMPAGRRMEGVLQSAESRRNFSQVQNMQKFRTEKNIRRQDAGTDFLCGMIHRNNFIGYIP